MVHGGSPLQYHQKVVYCEVKTYSIRRVASAVGGQGVWCEERICSIINVTSEVRVEKVHSTRKVASEI